ncbi:UNVERIFIED_CONTAM: hypothetical protein GTU68_002022 [Idotea baltica]|nr:hypothetical protein [Idotea baltica]
MKNECFGCKSTSDKIGVLIAQLGTPEAPTKKALRPYLKKFLGDPRIIEKPRWLWWIILNGIILTLRPKKSAVLYSRIWMKEGSPLKIYTERQCQALKARLQAIHPSIEVTYGMRYSDPSIETAIDTLIERGCNKILLFNIHCAETSEALIPKLNIPADQIIHTYQSRFGRDPWLEPYTDETFTRLGEEGVKNIAVACPGFTSDCLETLDEMGNEGQEEFEEAGGEKIELIPCLNDHPAWIDAMTSISLEEIGSWLTTARRTASRQKKIACPVKVFKAEKKRQASSSN